MLTGGARSLTRRLLRALHLCVYLLFAGRAVVPRANRAPSLPLFPRPVIDRGAPDMALGADPPDPSVASSRHLLRRQGSVQIRMPLSGNIRMGGSEVIETGQHLPARAIGASVGSTGPIHHFCPPGMTSGTLPPDIALAPKYDLIRSQRPVLEWVPLCRNGRILALQVVISGQRHVIGTDRTTGILPNTGLDRRLPTVALFTKPPDLFIVAGADLCRLQASIFCWMPLLCQIWMRGGKIVVARQNYPVRADRATAALQSRRQRRLPCMAFATTPPDLSMALGADIHGRQRRVFLFIPLTEQILPALFHTIFVQRQLFPSSS